MNYEARDRVRQGKRVGTVVSTFGDSSVVVQWDDAPEGSTSTVPNSGLSLVTEKKVAWYKKEDFKDKLMGGLKVGEASATSVTNFLLGAGYISAAEADTYSRVDSLKRQLYNGCQYWRERAVPVLSCENGLFIAKDEAEIQMYKTRRKTSAEAQYRTASLVLTPKGTDEHC
jgi:hypothetical protein